MQRWRALGMMGRRMCTAPNKALPPTPPPRGWGSGRGPISWRGAGVSLALGGGLLALVTWLKKSKRDAIERERQRSLGKASLGGEFELVDSEGKLRKSSEFLGQWILIYFGFTHCPDICPDELEKMSEVVEKIAKFPKAPPIQPLFISVDPERDSPEIVGKYCKEFSPKLLGLTGSVEQVKQACKAYRVYFSSGPKDQDADYIVDHTIIMYLVNPKGEFVDYYGQTKNAEEISSSIIVNIAKYDQINNTGWF